MQQNPNEKDVSKYPIVLHKILKKLHSFPDPILQKYQLSRIHVHYLVHLESCKQMPNAKAISEALGVNKANTSRALNDLIKSGYVVKKMVNKKQGMSLSDIGRQIAIELKENNKNEMRNLLNILTDEERLALRSILTKISENI